MSMSLAAAARERIIIAAHRGVSGGNVPCNTIAAYDAAVAHGADMIEVDANISADGTLYSFHPGMERAHLGQDCDIHEMHDGEIRKLRYVNSDRTPTQFGICTLEEIFSRFKNRCFINIDKFWEHPQKIAELIRRHGMEDQIVVKTFPSTEMFDLIEEYAPDIAYLPMIRKAENIHEDLLRRRMNYVGVEVLFAEDTDPLCSDAYIERIHADGKIVWGDAIVYNYRDQIGGRHSDDRAIAGDPEGSWGWLADKNFDIIQTDWTLAMRLFLESTGRRFRSAK